MDLVQELEAQGWVIETECVPSDTDREKERVARLQLEEYLSRQAVLKHIPSTKRGPVCPSETDLYLDERFGAGNMTLRFRYIHLCGEILIFDVVPNIEKNRAEIRMVEKTLLGENTTPWITILHVISR
jgi:hypothetical protein